ncbi:hypothetical protein CEXT_27801 [Caerostris extrusa]|uniref:Uncharacterized protein n=1 Tax=Caerostris extrusa TaxID=172846 RepID=A0AAV4U9B0_CAEEX|nr:hypothetical protein CEXT_27801 [Caerostris extrusa]
MRFGHQTPPSTAEDMRHRVTSRRRGNELLFGKTPAHCKSLPPKKKINKFPKRGRWRESTVDKRGLGGGVPYQDRLLFQKAHNPRTEKCKASPSKLIHHSMQQTNKSVSKKKKPLFRFFPTNTIQGLKPFNHPFPHTSIPRILALSD